MTSQRTPNARGTEFVVLLVVLVVAVAGIAIGAIVGGMAYVRHASAERELASHRAANRRNEKISQDASVGLATLEDQIAQAKAEIDRLKKAEADAAAGRAAKEEERAANGGLSGAAAEHRLQDAEQIVRHILQAVDGVGEKKSDFGKAVVNEGSEALVRLFPQARHAKVEQAFAGATSSHGLTDRFAVLLEREASASDALERSAATDGNDAAGGDKGAAARFRSAVQLASAQARAGSIDAALAKAKEALALVSSLPEKTRGKSHHDLLASMANWLASADRHAEAEPFAREALGLGRANGAEVRAWADDANQLARIQLAHDQFEAARATSLETIDACATAGIPGKVPDFRTARILQLHALDRLGRAEEASAMRELVMPEVWVETRRSGAFDDRDWTNFLIASGEVEEAERIRWRSVRTAFERGTNANLAEPIESLARQLEKAGHPERAAIYRRWLDRRANERDGNAGATQK